MTAGDWIAAAPAPVETPTVWRIDLALGADGPARCLSILSEDERGKADRYLRAEDRHRFVAARAALRTILGGTLHVDPRALTFVTGVAGKPELAGCWRGRLQFNLSHSGAWALIAVAPACRIGVDVEAIRPMADCVAIARSHFAPDEVAALTALPPDSQEDAFFACWTCKEAFVKALGSGLAKPLNGFSVTLPPAPPALVAIDGSVGEARRWTLRQIDPSAGYAGAVALDAPNARCELRSLIPNWRDRQG